MDEHVRSSDLDVASQVGLEACGELGPDDELTGAIELVEARMHRLDAGLGPGRPEPGRAQTSSPHHRNEGRRYHHLDLMASPGELAQEGHHRVQVAEAREHGCHDPHGPTLAVSWRSAGCDGPRPVERQPVAVKRVWMGW
jgi:hypothetical protein